MKNKTRNINIRLSNDELELLNKKCFDLKITKSNFIRSSIFDYVPDYELNKKLLELNYEIKKIGVNLNQIAKHLNQTGQINNYMLNNSLNNLENIRKSIMDNLLNNKYGCNKFMEDK